MPKNSVTRAIFFVTMRLRSSILGFLLLFLNNSMAVAQWSVEPGMADLCLHCLTAWEDAVEPGADAGPPMGTQALAAASSPLDRFPGYEKVRHHVREVAAELEVDHVLMQALIATESRFNAAAMGPGGAVGLMQILPSTAAHFGVTSDKSSSIRRKLTDPRINLEAGARYLRYLTSLFPGRIDLVVAAYNAGEGSVKRAGNRIPRNNRTPNYVKTVLRLYHQLSTAVLAADRPDASAAERVQTSVAPASLVTD